VAAGGGAAPKKKRMWMSPADMTKIDHGKSRRCRKIVAVKHIFREVEERIVERGIGDYGRAAEYCREEKPESLATEYNICSFTFIPYLITERILKYSRL
jgi:hypothetical protein